MPCARVALSLVTFVLLTALPEPASAQSLTAFSGSWQLNRGLSQSPREIGFNTALPTGALAGDTTQGRDADGGRRGGGRGAVSAEDADRTRFLTDEVRNPYERLTLTVTPDGVTIAPDRVAARAFHPGRRDEELMLGRVTGVATSSWDGDHLVIVYKADAARSVRYTYSLNASPRQLLVDVELLERGGGDKVRWVYEPGSPVESLGPSSPPVSPPAPARDAAAVDQRPGAQFRGLTTLGVVVESLGADAARCGVSQDALQAAVSKRLTDAGFRATRDSDDDTYLYVNINTAAPTAGLCISRYDVIVYSHATARLSHTSSPVLLQAELLRKGGMTGSGPATHADGVMKAVLETTDQFVSEMRAYLNTR